MDLADMNVKIGADIQAVTSALNQLTQNFNQVNGAIGKTGAVLDDASKRLAQVTASSAASSGGIRTLGNEATISTRHALGFAQGMTELAADVNRGTLNMGGFFEVLRVGASEFKVIQQETGSTLEGFKALGAAIFSEEAIILLVVTAVAKLASAFLESNAKSKEAAEKADEYKKALDSLEDGIAKEIFSLNELNEIATNVSNPYDIRVQAIKKLREEYGPYLKNLSDEQILNGEDAQALKDINNALIAKLTLEAGETQVVALLKERLDVQLKLNEAIKTQSNTATLANDLKNATGNAAGLAIQLQAANKTAQGIDLSSGLKTSQSVTEQYQKQIEDLNLKVAALFDTLKSSINESAGLDLGKITDAKPKVDEVSKALEELKNELKAIDLEEGVGADPVKRYEDIYNTVKKLLDLKVPAGGTIIQKLIGDASTIYVDNLSTFTNKALEQLEKNIKIPNLEQAPYVPVEIQPVYNKEAFNDIVKRAQVDIEAQSLHLNVDLSGISGNELNVLSKPLQDAFNYTQKLQDDFGVGLPDSIKTALDAFQKLDLSKKILYDSFSALQQVEDEYGNKLPSALQKYADALKKAANAGDSNGAKQAADELANANQSLKSLNSTIKQTVSSGLTSFFTDVGDALSGQNDPFGNLKAILAKGFETIGQAMIQYGVEVGIIQKLFANPLNPGSAALAIIAGIALEALGKTLEASVSHLAGGGIIPMGYPNDTFPAFLSSNEAVIPLDKLNQYIQPSSQRIEVAVSGQFEQQGDKLIAFISKAQKKFGRTY